MKLRNVLTVLGVLVFAATLATLVSRPLGAANGPPATPVSIVSPLPVPVSGTVSVGNTPLSVTGNVNLSGNSSSNPLFVRDVDNEGFAPFQAFNGSEGTQGGPQGLLQFRVPDGQRLVIEQVGAVCLLSNPSSDAPALGGFRLDVTGGGNSVEYELPTQTGLQGQVIVNLALKAYADPNSTVFLHISGISTGGTNDFPANSSCAGTIAGHTVSVP